MSVKDVYVELAKRLEHPDSIGLLKILRQVITPDEGELLLELPAPAGKLAKKLNRSEQDITNTIQSLWRRGVVMPMSQGFSFYNDVFGLWSSSVPSAPDVRDPEMLRLWKEWYETEWNFIMRNEWASEQGPALRIIPAWKSLEPLRKVSPGEVLPEDDPRQMFYGRQAISLHDCDCRLALGNCCDHPMETCFQFDNMAEHHIGRGAARRVSVDEAMAVLDLCEENGLVHLVFNRWPPSQVLSFCNCCASTCLPHESGLRNSTLGNNIAKTRYQSIVNQEICTGCQKCIERCNYDAITMEKVPGSKKLKASIDPEKCWGCGLCTMVCEPVALSMELVKPDNLPRYTGHMYMDNALVLNSPM